MPDRPGIVVVFSGGGTGGHLYPALALADALLEIRPDVRVFFVGASRGLEARVLPQRGLDHCLLPVEGFQRGRGLLTSWRAVPALVGSLRTVGELFVRLRPNAVVVTGGYASGPAGIAAGLMGLPLVVQEQNSVPGLTTRALSRWASRIHVAFPEASGHLPASRRDRVRFSGNPVRAVADVHRAEARRLLGLPETGLVLLVTGGSQGSLALNRTLEAAVRGFSAGELRRPDGLHVLWATGPKHFEGVSATLASTGSPAWIHAVPYLDDMPGALATADLALSRAGAMTTAELLNNGLPAILVPLPTAAADHQMKNAEALAQAGAAIVAPEEGLTGPALWQRVAALAEDAELRAEMRAAALDRARPAAAADIAQDVAALLPRVREAA
jgi:UDP-N-acetylglucosamine--N-acetylmuramyl-(pentapeptide) pyrophosphoryl-undecaprenol N-acetylglucosamine transferase